ncbi:MAG: hypothetical protein J6336_03380 [Kiritimatiellae bacterium]|nr:hypothetical protein [Kiritimatiellia bacterium]
MSLDLQPDTDLDGTAGGAGDAPALAPDWDRRWLIPVSPSTCFPVRVFNDTALPGTYTLSLDGSTNVFARYGNILLRGGQAAGVPFPSGPTEETVEMWAQGPGEATLTVLFEGSGGCSNYLCGTEMDITAYALTLEPVTAATNAWGVILNPCGVATGGLAPYRVDIEPADRFPDGAIHWSVAEGGVSFYRGHDTGRDAVIRGGAAECDFRLEVSVEGLPATVRPHIWGRVLEPKTVPIHAFIICSNGVPAVSASTVTNWVNEANRICRQAAMSFTLASVEEVENRDWFSIGDYTAFTQMCSYTNNTGGLELYCVKDLFSVGAHRGGTLGDARRGMAVRRNANHAVLAHEIGHSCGLQDVYFAPSNTLVCIDNVQSNNWSGGGGTGYYPGGTRYSDFVKRLLMYAYAVPDITDIPLDGVLGVVSEDEYEFFCYRRCGCGDMHTRDPSH